MNNAQIYHMGNVVDKGLEIQEPLRELEAWRSRALRCLRTICPSISWVSDPFDDAYLLKKEDGSAILGIRIFGDEPHSFTFTLKCIVQDLEASLPSSNPEVRAEIQYSELKDDIQFNITSIPFNDTEIMLTSIMKDARTSLVASLNEKYENFMKLAEIVKSLGGGD